jgi:hypothetical protein
LFSAPSARARRRARSASQSITSTSTSKPTWLRFSCTNSFIGSGCICPEPACEVRNFTLQRLAGP